MKEEQKTTPRVLILEDSEADAELAIRELIRADLKVETRRVDTRDAFLRELREFHPDVILSDFTLPQFTGLDALRLLKELDIPTPFILCTGSLTEEVAVECMKEGAFDYLLKSSLKRLPSAVLHALATNESRLQREAALEALRESEENFRSIVETTNEWVWASGVDGRVDYSNPAVQQIVGYLPDEVCGRNVLDLVHEDDREVVAKAMQAAAEGKRGWSAEIRRFRCKDGDIRFLESNAVPIVNGEGEVTGFRGADRDITERKRAEEQLLHDAFHDSLTGLANRTLFMEHLRLCVERGRSRRPMGYAVLYLDFDRFKVINDSLGHTEGDNLLRFMARRLEACTRPGDLIARFGGDEFVILLGDLVQPAEALLVVERILSDLNNAFNLGPRELFVTTSIGVALSSSNHATAEDMVRYADIAMYAAKTQGRAQYQIYDETMHANASRKLEIETEMRSAFENRQFRMYFQPIVHLATGTLAGFEALIRWEHPSRGVIAPNEFIPIAEENGMILKIGQWAVRESCAQLRRWQGANRHAAPLKVSVNLSGKEFRQPELARHISQALRDTGLDPGSLKIEITESQVMENSELAVAIVHRLRELGIELSLDDFGTGYSSLSYLHRLPFSYLKIDRSFVGLMTENIENYEIVHTIIRLAQSLKMRVIAEGIETPQQADALRLLGCDFGQGYYYARPLDVQAAEEFIRESFPTAPAGSADATRDIVVFDDRHELSPRF